MKPRFAIATLLMLALVSSANAAVKSMEAPSQRFDRAAHLARMLELQQRLGSSMVTLAAQAPLRIAISDDERRSIKQRVTNETKMAVGVVRELAIPIDFARNDVVRNGARMHDAFGATRGRDDGGFDWSGVIASDGAAAVRLHFTDVDLPAGAELYVFGRNGMAFGPYTGRGPNGDGDFWSNTIAGSEIVIQLSAGANGSPRFTIAGLGYLTDDFAIAKSLAPRLASDSVPPCTYNASCIVDAACVTTNPAVDTAKNAVAHILFVSRRILYYCSGGLVADSDPSTEIPYFITANHCISTRAEAESIETYFFYAATTCGGCPARGAASTTGATLVKTARRGDYTLVQLAQPAPAGTAFLGWNSNPIAFAGGTDLYRISHPHAAPQAYSEHVVDTSRPACREWPRGDWIYSVDILGGIEPGSSGAPVVNSAGEMVGQLSGFCGSNELVVCDPQSNATADGAFAEYYSGVSRFLGTGRTH